MKLPRWTAYPALALLFAMVIVAIPHRTDPVSAPTSGHPRVVVLGIDGMDPEILQEVMDLYPERMPHFRRLAEEGGVHSLGTSTPPQSPVAWSNFITGTDPGGHGIFDFIHRDKMHRGAAPSTSADAHSDEFGLPGQWQFPLDDAGRSNRSGEAFWTTLARAGVPADVWRMPANFPVEPADGLSFSGMMTPAIDSAYGECTFYTSNPPVDSGVGDERIIAVTEYDGRIDTRLPGPANAFKDGRPATSVPLVCLIDREAGAVAVDTGANVLVLQPGQWSEFVPVAYDMLPMGVMPIGGTVRFYLRSIDPEFELYASPVNIDPANPVAPVSEPSDASEKLADRHRGGIGPYYTQGMPEDVNALKREVLTVPEFMAQAGLVHDEGERMMEYALDHYLNEQDGGLLFYYYSSVDLCCHMMWRHADTTHPDHDAQIAAGDSSRWSGREGSTWKDVVHDLYLQMDPVLGRVRERVGDDVTLIVMSDHGFASYARKFSLNTWLYENGYLVLREGREVERPQGDPALEQVFLSGKYDADESEDGVDLRTVVDWSKTRAYGVGFNALYLNLKGREQDDPETKLDESGIVEPGPAAEALLAEIKGKLESLLDPKDGRRVVLHADLAREVYHGARLAEAPDLLIGYNSGYGNSDESSSGRIPREVLSDNDRGGTFNGSHLMAPEVVPGLLMTNRRVLPGQHSLEDLTVELLSRFGLEPGPGLSGHRVIE